MQVDRWADKTKLIVVFTTLQMHLKTDPPPQQYWSDEIIIYISYVSGNKQKLFPQTELTS
jgi:hypothetical protein